MTEPDKSRSRPLANPKGVEPNPYPGDKMGDRLRDQGAAAVREHDRKENDRFGRVHRPGFGK